MSQMRVDMEDFIALPVFVICSMVGLGLLSATPMGFDLGATLVNLGEGHTFSIASIGALATLGYVAYTNEWGGHLTWIQAWIIAATFGLIVAPPFVPVLQSTLASGPAALIALGIQIGGYMAFSIIG